MFGELQNAYKFHVIIKSKSILSFWVACLLAYENLQGNYFKFFSPLMGAIIHAWRDFFIDEGDFTCLAGQLEK